MKFTSKQKAQRDQETADRRADIMRVIGEGAYACEVAKTLRLGVSTVRTEMKQMVSDGILETKTGPRGALKYSPVLSDVIKSCLYRRWVPDNGVRLGQHVPRESVWAQWLNK